jgi:hypothetical protein
MKTGKKKEQKEEKEDCLVYLESFRAGGGLEGV